MSAKEAILNVAIKYSMREVGKQICDKILTENLKKDKMGLRKFYMNFNLKDGLGVPVFSLKRQTDARREPWHQLHFIIIRSLIEYSMRNDTIFFSLFDTLISKPSNLNGRF